MTQVEQTPETTAQVKAHEIIGAAEVRRQQNIAYQIQDDAIFAKELEKMQSSNPRSKVITSAFSDPTAGVRLQDKFVQTLVSNLQGKTPEELERLFINLGVTPQAIEQMGAYLFNHPDAALYFGAGFQDPTHPMFSGSNNGENWGVAGFRDMGNWAMYVVDSINSITDGSQTQQIAQLSSITASKDSYSLVNDSLNKVIKQASSDLYQIEHPPHIPWWKKWIGVIVCAAVIIAAVVATVITDGAAAPLLSGRTSRENSGLI